MKLGLLSAILPDYSFEQVIDIAKQFNYSAVEICCWPTGKANRRYSGVTHIDVDKLTDEKINHYLAYAKERNIEIMALGYYPNALDSNETTASLARKHIKKVIKAAHLLGINRVSTFIGKNQYLSDEENFKLFEQFWPEIILFAEKLNVQVGIENCPMYFTKDEWPGGQNLASSPVHWRRMFQIIDSKFFGLSYDPSHLHLQGMDYVSPLYEFKDKIFHVHLKDIEVYQEKINEFGIFTYPLNYMSPKIPGKGGINWNKFINALYDINYNNCACVEIEDKDYEDSKEHVLKAIQDSYTNTFNFFK